MPVEMCGPFFTPRQAMEAQSLKQVVLRGPCQPLPGLWMGGQITHREPQISVGPHVVEPLPTRQSLAPGAESPPKVLGSQGQLVFEMNLTCCG